MEAAKLWESLLQSLEQFQVPQRTPGGFTFTTNFDEPQAILPTVTIKCPCEVLNLAREEHLIHP